MEIEVGLTLDLSELTGFDTGLDMEFKTKRGTIKESQFWVLSN